MSRKIHLKDLQIFVDKERLYTVHNKTHSKNKKRMVRKKCGETGS